MSAATELALRRVVGTYLPEDVYSPGQEQRIPDWLLHPDWLRAEVDRVACLYNRGEWIPLAGEPIVDLLDVLGALEFAHVCTFLDAGAKEVRDLAAPLRSMDLARFPTDHQLFGPAARLEIRLSDREVPSPKHDSNAYAACESYLLLSSEARSDSAFQEFVHAQHASHQESAEEGSDWKEWHLLAQHADDVALASPEAFAQAVAEGLSGRSPTGRLTAGGLQAAEYLRAFSDILRLLHDSPEAREMAIRCSRWVHLTKVLEEHFRNWARASRSWIEAPESPGADERMWGSFHRMAIAPVEEGLRYVDFAQAVETGAEELDTGVRPSCTAVLLGLSPAEDRYHRRHRIRHWETELRRLKETGSEPRRLLEGHRALIMELTEEYGRYSRWTLKVRLDLATTLFELRDPHALDEARSLLAEADWGRLGKNDPLLLGFMLLDQRVRASVKAP